MRAVALALILACLAPASASALDAGVGRSDVTPPTGFPTMGYVRDDAIARGQHTRLYARAIVFKRGGTKLAWPAIAPATATPTQSVSERSSHTSHPRVTGAVSPSGGGRDFAYRGRKTG